MSHKLHEWIKSVIDTTPNLTQKGLAEAMGLNPAAVNRMLYGARQIKVTELPVIEAYLGKTYAASKAEDVQSPQAQANASLPVNRHDVFGGGDFVSQFPGFRDRGGNLSYHTNGDPNWAEMMVPVYGYAAASLDSNLNLANGEIVDWVIRHPSLNGIRDAFAIYVFSDSMEPRYYPGELVYIHPGRPPEHNKDCVIELKSGDAYLKRYMGQNDAEVTVMQYNPQKKMTFDKADIQALYAVVGRA